MLRRLLHALGCHHWREVADLYGWMYRECRLCPERTAVVSGPGRRSPNARWLRGEVDKPWEETPYRPRVLPRGGSSTAPLRGPSGGDRPPAADAMPTVFLSPAAVTLTPEALLPPVPPDATP